MMVADAGGMQFVVCDGASMASFAQVRAAACYEAQIERDSSQGDVQGPLLDCSTRTVPEILPQNATKTQKLYFPQAVTCALLIAAITTRAPAVSTARNPQSRPSSVVDKHEAGTSLADALRGGPTGRISQNETSLAGCSRGSPRQVSRQLSPPEACSVAPSRCPAA